MSKILVVDDEPSMLAAFVELLGGLEHEVVTTPRADAAIELLAAAAADLVILDIQLPGMSGLEALGHIKRQHPKLPVIVITGHGTMSTAIEATKLGAFDYQSQADRTGGNAGDDRQGPGGCKADARRSGPGRRERSRLGGGHHWPQPRHAGGVQGDRTGCGGQTPPC